MEHATTPVARSLDAVIGAHTRALVRVLPKAIAGDALAVHRSRVASRRLREVLPLAEIVASGHDARDLRRTLRRITRALGRVREIDVTMAVFQAQAQQHPTAAVPLAAIARTWARQRDAACRAMATKLGRIQVRQLRVALLSLSTAVAAEPRQAWTRAIESQVRRRAASLSSDLAQLGSLYVPERLHAVRIAAKKLRYSLEAGRDAAGFQCEREIKELIGAQDLLGEWHDLHIVERRVQAMSETRRRTGARAASALVRQCDADCRDRHARFLALAPHLIDVCDRLRARAASRTMLRMSAPATARETTRPAAIRRA
jgi:CHAD domain-containing protein